MMPCATRSTKGPATSVMVEPTDEVNQDETSLHKVRARAKGIYSQSST